MYGAKPQMARHLNAARATDRWCGEAYYAKAPALKWNNRLAQAALAHSRDMAENERMNHVGSDGSNFVERAKRAGYRGEPLGENIAFGYDSSEAVVYTWLESPGHCANIMQPRATEFGAATQACYDTLVLGRHRP
jgi:uncharacterized protein YkwD